jgi:hypothetical protein
VSNLQRNREIIELLMIFSEIDWRLSSTRGIFQALSYSLKEVAQLLKDAQEDYQINYCFDQTENLLGIAFVRGQTYITGTVSDVNEIVGTKTNKNQLLKRFSDRLENSEVTKIELCDAIANYFKHHDEWESWSPTERNRKTISILVATGIKETDEYPCDKAASLLWSNSDEDLEPLLELLTKWREAVINHYVSQSEAK